MHINWH